MKEKIKIDVANWWIAIIMFSVVGFSLNHSSISIMRIIAKVLISSGYIIFLVFLGIQYLNHKEKIKEWKEKILKRLRK